MGMSVAYGTSRRVDGVCDAGGRGGALKERAQLAVEGEGCVLLGLRGSNGGN